MIKVTYKFIIIAVFSSLTAGEHDNADAPKTEEGGRDSAVVTKADENEEEKKKSVRLSYLEKLQNRYVARLPYIMVPAMIVPIIKHGELFGYLTIMPQIKSNSVESYRKLWVEIITIKDEIFCDLFYAMSRLWIAPEPPSAEVLEKRIKKRLKKFFKEDLVEEVSLHLLHLSILKTENNEYQFEQDPLENLSRG